MKVAAYVGPGACNCNGVILTHLRHNPRATMTHIRYDTQVVCVILGDIRLTRVHMLK